MRKGIILEINDLYLTLLTPEGEFLRARKLQQDYQVGEEIDFFPEMAADKRKKFNIPFMNSYRARSMAIAAAIMLAFAALMPIYQDGQVYAYMSIDVNPSVEMAVNDDLQVLRLEGYNDEGKEIVSGMNGWKKKDAAAVAEMILDKIEENGYFKEDNDILIATVHKGKVKKEIDQKLEQKILKIKKATKDENLELKVLQGTPEERANAHKEGITTGLYKEKLSNKQQTVNPTTPDNDQQDSKKNDISKPLVQPERKTPAGQLKKALPEKGGPGKGNPSNKPDHSNKPNQSGKAHQPAAKPKDRQTDQKSSKKNSADKNSAENSSDKSQGNGKKDDTVNRGKAAEQNKNKQNVKETGKKGNKEYTGKDKKNNNK